MDKKYDIFHIGLKSHSNKLIYNPMPSTEIQHFFIILCKLDDKYFSNVIKKEKEYILNHTWKQNLTLSFLKMIKKRCLQFNKYLTTCHLKISHWFKAKSIKEQALKNLKKMKT